MLLVMFCFLGNKKQHKTNKNKQETTHMPPTQTSKLELFTEKKKCQHKAKLFSLSKEFKKKYFNITFAWKCYELFMSGSISASSPSTRKQKTYDKLLSLSWFLMKKKYFFLAPKTHLVNCCESEPTEVFHPLSSTKFKPEHKWRVKNARLLKYEEWYVWATSF